MPSGFRFSQMVLIKDGPEGLITHSSLDKSLSLKNYLGKKKEKSQNPTKTCSEIFLGLLYVQAELDLFSDSISTNIQIDTLKK